MKIPSRKSVLTLALFFVASMASAEEPDALRIQALKAIHEKASATTGAEQLSLFRQLRDALDSVLDDYPASDAAVDILLRREVDGLELDEMDAALLAALGDAPQALVGTGPANVPQPSSAGSQETAAATSNAQLPNFFSNAATPSASPATNQTDQGNGGAASTTLLPESFINMLPPAAAPGSAQDAGEAETVAVLPNFFLNEAPAAGGSTPAQTEQGAIDAQPSLPEPGAQFPPATESTEKQLALSRKDIREIQARLTAIGIDPNGIDGVVGRGTRSALQAWQQGAGLPVTGYVDAAQLTYLRTLSQAPFDAWLTDPKNRVRIEVVEITPTAMSGSWRFTARCGPNSRLAGRTISGVMAMNHVGGGSYKGSVRNSEGLIGAVSGTVSGRRISTLIDWGLFFGRVRMQGEISDDARTVRGRDSNGCSVTARKG